VVRTGIDNLYKKVKIRSASTKNEKPVLAAAYQIIGYPLLYDPNELYRRGGRPRANGTRANFGGGRVIFKPAAVS